jgi:hypothetical protein
MAVLLSTASQMPAFFAYLEARPGALLYDPILNALPPVDLSGPIFVLIYVPVVYAIVRSLLTPTVLIHFLTGYVLLLLTRILTLWLTPLDPPLALVPLVDPLGLVLYGGIPVTRDLFFSGHTATAFLIYQCLPSKIEKRVSGVVVVLMVMGLLLQHIHYAVDIVAAIPFAYLCAKATAKLIPLAAGQNENP